MRQQRIIKSAIWAVLIALLVILPHINVQAKALDEIVDFTVTVDVNADATLSMQYDIAWKVLDSDSEGPLSWSNIGLPNKNYSSIRALSSNISSIKVTNSGGTFAEVHFDRDYYADEIIQFSFYVIMDNMYSVYPDDNYAEYKFTPAWFDDIAIDNLTIRWNNDQASGWSPDCLVENGYNVWNTSLRAGEKYPISVKYPDDAYEFNLTQKQSGGSSSSYEFSDHKLWENILIVILGILFGLVVLLLTAAPILLPIVLVFFILYKSKRGFSSASQKKITRTIIEYYPACPNCGAGREEGKETCAYCGTNLVKSRQEVTEEDIPTADKGALSYEKNGEYKFSDNPNRYVRVHVVPVPVTTHHTYHSSGSRSTSSSRGSSSHRSSCAHSSCACACACACAGGGRAGCTTKDFYHTDLKLSYLANRRKR